MKKKTALAKKAAPIVVRRPTQNLPEQIETLLMQGDLTGLSVQQRLVFYKDLCRSLGLNYRTRPFEYLVFTDRDQDDEQPGAAKAGKMVLYARADCAAQLRKIHHVGIDKNMRRRREDEFYYVEADAFIHEKNGDRTDTATGVVWLKKWKNKNGQRTLVDLQGREMANAIMKAETKAKRRVTFSICGLHMLDESELDDLTAMTYDVSETGRVIEMGQRPAELAIPSQDNALARDVAFYIAEADRSDKPFKEKLDGHMAELQKLTTEQLQSLLQKYREKHQVSREPERSAKVEGAATTGVTPPGAQAAPIEPSDSVTLRELSGGWWRIEGVAEVLRPVREEIKAVCRREKLPDLICDSKGCGKMLVALERAKVPHRMVSDGERT